MKYKVKILKIDILHYRVNFMGIPVELNDLINEYIGVIGTFKYPIYTKDELIIPVNSTESIVPVSKNTLRVDENPLEINEVSGITKIIIAYQSIMYGFDSKNIIIDHEYNTEKPKCFTLGAGNDPCLNMNFFSGDAIRVIKDDNNNPVIQKKFSNTEFQTWHCEQIYTVSPYGDLGAQIILMGEDLGLVNE